jgi:hypothetical protein
MLVLEGGYYETNDGPKFWWVEPPTDKEPQARLDILVANLGRVNFAGGQD